MAGRGRAVCLGVPASPLGTGVQSRPMIEEVRGSSPSAPQHIGVDLQERPPLHRSVSVARSLTHPNHRWYLLMSGAGGDTAAFWFPGRSQRRKAQAKACWASWTSHLRRGPLEIPGDTRARMTLLMSSSLSGCISRPIPRNVREDEEA